MAKESYTLLDNQIWEDENLSHTEFRVLSYLIRTYRVEYGYSFPKRETIAKKCKIHKDTLNKVLNSLEENGYITRAINPRKGGRNNIYYIHKCLVASKKDTTQAPADAKPSENERKPCETDAKANEVEVESGREQSVNELLVEQKAKLRGKMSDLKREAINELDTDILTQAIDRANKVKPQGYFIGYILSICDDIKKDMENNPREAQREAQSNKPSNNSNNNKKDNTWATGEYHNNNYPVRTKYHGTFNEHFRKYTEDELEANLLKAQAKKKKGVSTTTKQEIYNNTREMINQQDKENYFGILQSIPRQQVILLINKHDKDEPKAKAKAPAEGPKVFAGPESEKANVKNIWTKEASKSDNVVPLDREDPSDKVITNTEVKFIYSRGLQAGYTQEQIKSHIAKKFNKNIEELTKRECLKIVEGYQIKILRQVEG